VLKTLRSTSAIIAVLALVPSYAAAQTIIDTDQNTQIRTSTAGDNGAAADVTVNSGVTITAPDANPVIIIDSDNSVTNSGTIASTNIDNSIGIELIGGNSGNFTNNSQINILEDFTPEDTDGNGILDGDFAEGTGRVGILISGASPFIGNLTQGTAGAINIEGNNSAGIRLAETAGLSGDIDLGGIINLSGGNSLGVDVAGRVIGNLALNGQIAIQGADSGAISVSGGIDGGLIQSGSITNTGYRFQDRPALSGRNLLDEEDLRQGGSAVQISSDISNGYIIQQLTETTTADDGTETTLTTARGTISQFGEAPAILINGNGTPLAIGRVGQITDPTAEGFDEDLLYAFVNQGDVLTNGVFNDINATAFSVTNTTLVGGINNTGTIRSTTFRSGGDTPDVTGQTGLSRVIVLGDNTIAERINNSGLIVATITEAADEVFADPNAILNARPVRAVAIDIAASAELTEIINSNGISAVLTARTGDAIAIQDASGTLTRIDNTGTITALGLNSDAQGLEATNFNLIALDLSVNSTGVTITQSQQADNDPDDNIIPVSPLIVGDILLGSGNDSLTSTAGRISGDINFGDGADSLSLTDTVFTGNITDTDGDLTIAVVNSSIIQTDARIIDVTTASFDENSVFRPVLDGATGEASTLLASGAVSFADGAEISPVLNNVVAAANSTFEIVNAGDLTIDGNLDTLSSIESPFLYRTAFAINPDNPDVLVVTLDLRSTDELGLDPVQSATFNSAFEALENNSGLANAVINISEGGAFNNALNQLLPEFAAAGRQFVLANVDGSVGAVGSHLDTTRRSQERTGGIWVEEFAYFADRELTGLSEAYRGHGFGFTAGIDTAFGPFHAAGLNIGFASTEIEDVLGTDEPLDIVTIQAGLYGGLEFGGLSVDLYGGVGYNDFESNRIVEIDNFRSTANGDWNGTHFNGSIKAGYDLNLSDRFWVRPTVSLDYLSLTENAYTETGDVGVALSLDDRTSEIGSGTALINLGTKIQGKRTWVKPAIRAGYRTDFINDGIITAGRFAGLSTPFEIESEAFPDSGFLLGFTIAAGSEYSSFALDFDSDIRDGFIRHTGRIVFRLLF